MNVLHFAINSGTDLALFKEIAAKGWVNRLFIGTSTSNFDAAMQGNKCTSRSTRSRCGDRTRMSLLTF